MVVLRPTTIRKVISQKKAKRDSSMENRQVFYYRCPKCHHIVGEEQLFGTGCPICGWISPVKIPRELSAEKDRKGLVDVFDEKNYISVIAELPGVEEKDIEATLTDKILEISAGKYSKTIILPSTPSSIIERTYKHGVLQLKIERDDNGS